jgi:glycosyltransferase involved in cell wall biosynthesis
MVIHPPLPERRTPGPPRSGRPYVLFHGGYDPRKNVGVFLEAFSIFATSPSGTNFDLVIVGDGTESLLPQLRALGIEHRTTVQGYVSEDRKWEWTEQAACVAYPSSYEGFGLVIAEAFACGVPAVTGTGGSLREVGAGATITVDPTDPGSIARGLAEATDSQARAALREAGYTQLEALRSRGGGYADFIIGVSGFLEGSEPKSFSGAAK